MVEDALEKVITEVNTLTAVFKKLADSGLKAKWWHSLPIPGLYQPIDFEHLYLELDKINDILKFKISEISALQNELPSDTEKAYAAAMIEEYSAFEECSKRLRTLYFGLYNKSLGSKGVPYPVEQYRKDLRDYGDGFRSYYATSRKVDYFVEKVVNAGR